LHCKKFLALAAEICFPDKIEEKIMLSVHLQEKPTQIVPSRGETAFSYGDNTAMHGLTD